MRIVHVARDAAVQRMLGGDEFAAQVVRSRAGGAFDPGIAVLFAERVAGMVAIGSHASVWAETLACEPRPNLVLEGEAVDRALGAIGAFADLASPYLVGHSAGVAELAAAAGGRYGLDASQIMALRRAALVHDVGRVAVPVRIWQHGGPLSPDDWERVRLHAYYTERVLSRSRFLAALAPIATSHHERLDGSGYHKSCRRAPRARTPAGGRRCLPRHDRAAAAPRPDVARTGRRDARWAGTPRSAGSGRGRCRARRGRPPGPADRATRGFDRP
jgi:hypothetical protein